MSGYAPKALREGIAIEYSVPHLDKHATALGYACITYARLETTIFCVIGQLARTDLDTTRAIVDATGSSIEARCNLALKLSYVHSPSQIWTEALEYNINYIRREIAPNRNRLIHDDWSGGPGGVNLVDKRVFLRKTPNVETKKVADIKVTEMPVSDIWLLINKIEAADMLIHDLLIALHEIRTTGEYSGKLRKIGDD